MLSSNTTQRKINNSNKEVGTMKEDDMDDPSDKNRRMPSGGMLHTSVTAFLFFFCIILLIRINEYHGDTASQNGLDGTLMQSIKQKDIELSMCQQSLSDNKKDIEELNDEKQELRRDNQKLKKKYKMLKDEMSSKYVPKSNIASFKNEKRNNAIEEVLARTKDAIQLLSTELLKIKFGDEEPYYAKMTVGFPDVMGLPSQGEILIEFASSEIMPTAVLYFLTQISEGLWDGCSFIRNAHHVLQASPQTVNRQGLYSRFEKLSYQRKSIPFQEYSDEFPHEKYTIGLAGRPGGADFYISTQDNTDNHGPGGQGSYDLPEEADSCFAKVVKGIDVVDRMHTAPYKHDNFNSLIDYIEILRFEVVATQSLIV